MNFKKFNEEGYVSLITGALFSVGLIGLAVYFIAKSGSPDNPTEEAIELVIELAAEDLLGLPDGSVKIDLTPKTIETTDKKEDE